MARALAEHDIVSYDGRPWGEIFGVSVFGPTRRGSVLTRRWSEALRSRLDARLDDLGRARAANPGQDGDCLGWGEILRDLIVPVAGALHQEGRLAFHPIPGDRFAASSQLFGRGELFAWRTFEPPPTADLLILNNALYPDWFKNLDRDQVLRGPWGMSSLIRRALNVDA